MSTAAEFIANRPLSSFLLSALVRTEHSAEGWTYRLFTDNSAVLFAPNQDPILLPHDFDQFADLPQAALPTIHEGLVLYNAALNDSQKATHQ